MQKLRFLHTPRIRVIFGDLLYVDCYFQPSLLLEDSCAAVIISNISTINLCINFVPVLNVYFDKDGNISYKNLTINEFMSCDINIQK